MIRASIAAISSWGTAGIRLLTRRRVAGRAVRAGIHFGREELVDGERHSVEQIAGIVLGGPAAFFFGHAELCGRYYYLHFAHKPYHREQSKSYIDIVAYGRIGDI